LEPMVRDAQDAIAEMPEVAPRMLRQPADAPPAVGHVGTSAPVVSLRRILSDRPAGSGRSFRGWAARVSGRSDRRLLLALAGATDAMATHCDLLADRLAAQEAVTADVADVYGKEIALLRAELVHLRRSEAALREAGA